MRIEPSLERTISIDEVLGMERLTRMRLINSISGMKSANRSSRADDQEKSQ